MIPFGKVKAPTPGRRAFGSVVPPEKSGRAWEQQSGQAAEARSRRVGRQSAAVGNNLSFWEEAVVLKV